MMEDAVQRDLGRMEAQIATLTATVATQSVELAKINQTLSEAKGGWRTLLWIGGVSGVVGGVIAKMFPFFTMKP